MEEEIKIENPFQKKIHKCQNCGLFYRENKEGKKRNVSRPWKDENGNIIWKNLFTLDWRDLMMIFIIIILLLSYKHDINQFKEIIKSPCSFCGHSGCYDQFTSCVSPINTKSNITFLINSNGR